MKTVLITGATDGIGKATAKQLKRRGWRVLLHGRSTEKLHQLARDLVVPKQDVYNADFRSLDEVKQFGKTVANQHAKLDVLVNNAGVFMKERNVTADGFETTMQVNHFAHWLLTHYLLPPLQEAKHGRIVSVSSIAHRNGFLQLDNLDFHHGWDGYGSYATSKLANVLFSNELARRLAKTNTTSNSLHPGVINTKLLRGGFHFIGKPTSSGGKAIVYLVDSAEVKGVSGQYFVHNHSEMPAPQAQDAGLAKDFWELSQQLLHKWL